MLLSFGEMLAALYSDLKYAPIPDPAVVIRLKRLLNEAHRTILRTRKMSEERGLELTFRTEAHERYYGLPQAFDSINDIRQMDESICMVMRSRDWLVHQDPQENTIGTPYVWIPNGMQPVSRQPSIQGSGLWAVSTSDADMAQSVRVMCVRASGGLVVEQTATLTGTTPVRVGTLGDIAAVMQFTLSAPCAGSVSLIDAPDLPFSFTTPPIQPPSEVPFPVRPVIDNFNRPDENPLSGGGQWLLASRYSLYPLAVVAERAALSNPTYLAASYLNTRFSAADAEAFVTVAVLPGIPPAAGPDNYCAISFTLARPTFDGPVSGYLLALARVPSGAFRLRLGRFDDSTHTVLATVDSLSFAAGDGFGIERDGALVRVHVRNAGLWRQVAEVSAASYPDPLYPALILSDDTAKLDDFGGGPYHSRILGTIDGHSGVTAQPYFSIRLWPTPQGPLTYTVKGTVRIPDMVRDEDYPIFVQPEYCDALMTYCRAREYKTVKADTERWQMEQEEWATVLGGLNAAANFPKDYRPVAGGSDRGRWSNLGGFYPADVGGWNW